MDGYEVARCLRTEMGESAPLLVAMTGYGQHEVNRHACRVEFDHHLVKPADMGVLKRAVDARQIASESGQNERHQACDDIQDL